ncbi:MAG: NTP transferase domain-containing protein [Candidatus Omnitrophica bacterium]|nr:NTP transferase domain-containing protein [Candidatus Omnitrophota bacterium]
MKQFTAIVLAAGKGKRMNSAQPKVLESLMGKPLIYYVIAELLLLKKQVKQIVVVTGYKGELVKKEVRNNFPEVLHYLEFVNQKKLDGTAKAVQLGSKKAKHGNILVVCGDTPLITNLTLKKFIASYLRKKLACCVLTAVMERENSLGLIVYDKFGKLKSITEKIELKNSRRGLLIFGEVNSGIYCFERKTLVKNLAKIKMNKRKKEYFLTDIVEILYQQKAILGSYLLPSFQEITGINSKQDLALARRLMQRRIIESLINRGVNVIDPETTFIEAGVKVGKNTVIYPFTFIEKGVIIGSCCSLGPFARLRKGTSIGDNSHIGDFIELNRSKIGRNVRMKHFGYIGDAVVEDNVNIGAGTVTANFDGKLKQKTYIRKGSFIGSDTILVAPLEVGKNSTTGAGSVVTRNVKSGTVVVGVPAKKLKKRG